MKFLSLVLTLAVLLVAGSASQARSFFGGLRFLSAGCVQSSAVLVQPSFVQQQVAVAPAVVVQQQSVAVQSFAVAPPLVVVQSQGFRVRRAGNRFAGNRGGPRRVPRRR